MPTSPLAGRAMQSVLAVLALVVFLLAASAHLSRTCTVMDTPYLPLCSATPAGPPEALAQVRERIANNPGDSDAWTKLLVQQPGDASLKGAALLAPNDPVVLRRRAADLLKKGDMAGGTALLVEMLRLRNAGEAAVVLARIAASPEGVAVLRPHLATAKDWLPQVLAAMVPQKLPLSQALPLVAEASANGNLPLEAQRSYMRWLKGGGYWLDAYGLWLAQHKQELPLLYNASFDEAFEVDGFDWEFPQVARSRAGSLLDQPTVARRGRVLELEFTGRHLARPMVWQYVFVAPGSYRFRGDFMASKLRTQEGLVWSVRCMLGNKPPIARSQPMMDTGGVWRNFEVLFTVPADCGPVVALQLDVAAEFEAAIGIRGTVDFDNFGLAHATY